jgi:hypothetical protein
MISASSVQKDRRRKPRLSLSLFLWTLAAALVLELGIIPKLDTASRSYLLVGHLAISLFIASFLGLTYDYVLSKQREESVRELVGEFYGDLRQMLLQIMQGYILGNADQIFSLLRDIISQNEKIPTLYKPTRHENEESSFANNLDYFDTLVAVRRDEVVHSLREWVQDPTSPVNLKFLASDFVGKYELVELATQLRQEAHAKLARWDLVTDTKERSWTLNYLWAVSRCERPRYASLAELLAISDKFVHEWILFVPLQMPDPEFIPILQTYLEKSASALDNLDHVEAALGSLQREGYTEANELLAKLAAMKQALPPGKISPSKVAEATKQARAGSGS